MMDEHGNDPEFLKQQIVVRYQHGPTTGAEAVTKYVEACMARQDASYEVTLEPRIEGHVIPANERMVGKRFRDSIDLICRKAFGSEMNQDEYGTMLDDMLDALKGALFATAPATPHMKTASLDFKNELRMLAVKYAQMVREEKINEN